MKIKWLVCGVDHAMSQSSNDTNACAFQGWLWEVNKAQNNACNKYEMIPILKHKCLKYQELLYFLSQV